MGLPASVQKARELILADLDAKSERVTLKIDVSFAEHSHVIGKEGANIKKGKSQFLTVAARHLSGVVCHDAWVRVPPEAVKYLPLGMLS